MNMNQSITSQGTVPMRNCSSCSKELTYKNRTQYLAACRKKTICKICARNKPKDLTSKFSRECPSCSTSINYINKNSYLQAVKHSRLCLSCVKNPVITSISLTRNCPSCSQPVIYLLRDSLVRAMRINALCNSCKQKGDKNCMYGKHHTEEHKLKIAKSMCETLGIPYHPKDKTNINTDFFKSRLILWANRNKIVHPYCDNCSSAEHLHAHHRLYKCEFPEYALKDWNCRVLCESCHKAYHKEHGHSTPTEELSRFARELEDGTLK